MRQKTLHFSPFAPNKHLLNKQTYLVHLSERLYDISFSIGSNGKAFRPILQNNFATHASYWLEFGALFFYWFYRKSIQTNSTVQFCNSRLLLARVWSPVFLLALPEKHSDQFYSTILQLPTLIGWSLEPCFSIGSIGKAFRPILQYNFATHDSYWLEFGALFFYWFYRKSIQIKPIVQFCNSRLLLAEVWSPVFLLALPEKHLDQFYSTILQLRSFISWSLELCFSIG
jgi:hypothetical protein